MNQFRIGKHLVGDDAPVFLVAELSANHGQRKDIALRTIEAAAKAGADAIKLQTYTPDTLTLKSDAPPFVVKTKNAWAGRTLWDLYREAMTPWDWHAELKEATEALGLEWFSTPFDETAVAFLERLGAVAHKVASFELNDLPLVERMARTGKPLVISTGMARLGDIESALATCREAGNERLALLRCVSSYPARPEMMDLASFDVLRGFGTVVGLSDHTRDSTVAIASVALGAKLIEKHFILDREVGGPDSFFSLEPEEFASMVKSVRDTEKALGRPRFGASADEVASTSFRRSLFVARDVKAGETLTCDDVRSVRPADGLHPRFMPEVLGRVAARDLSAATPLTWDAVGVLTPHAAIELRAATSDDSARLLGWRNDATTRAMSIERGEVSHTDHDRWLTSILSDSTRALFICTQAEKEVGTVRLSARAAAESEIAITVAPEHRRKGLAHAILVAAERVARERGDRRLVAQIRMENEASMRAFKRAGYYGFVEADGAYTCERRISPFA